MPTSQLSLVNDALCQHMEMIQFLGAKLPVTDRCFLPIATRSACEATALVSSWLLGSKIHSCFLIWQPQPTSLFGSNSSPRWNLCLVDIPRFLSTYLLTLLSFGSSAISHLPTPWQNQCSCGKSKNYPWCFYPDSPVLHPTNQCIWRKFAISCFLSSF